MKFSSGLKEMSGENSEQNVLREAMTMIKQQQSDEDQGADEFLLQEYEHFLANKAKGTIDQGLWQSVILLIKNGIQ